MKNKKLNILLIFVCLVVSLFTINCSKNDNTLYGKTFVYGGYALEDDNQQGSLKLQDVLQNQKDNFMPGYCGYGNFYDKDKNLTVEAVQFCSVCNEALDTNRVDYVSHIYSHVKDNKCPICNQAYNISNESTDLTAFEVHFSANHNAPDIRNLIKLANTFDSTKDYNEQFNDACKNFYNYYEGLTISISEKGKNELTLKLGEQTLTFKFDSDNGTNLKAYYIDENGDIIYERLENQKDDLGNDIGSRFVTCKSTDEGAYKKQAFDIYVDKMEKNKIKSIKIMNYADFDLNVYFQFKNPVNNNGVAIDFYSPKIYTYFNIQ